MNITKSQWVYDEGKEELLLAGFVERGWDEFPWKMAGDDDLQFCAGIPRDAKADLPSSKFGGHFNFRNIHSYHITFEEGLERMIGWTTLSIRSRSVAIQGQRHKPFCPTSLLSLELKPSALLTLPPHNFDHLEGHGRDDLDFFQANRQSLSLPQYVLTSL
jgi:hypothetical protein